MSGRSVSGMPRSCATCRRAACITTDSILGERRIRVCLLGYQGRPPALQTQVPASGGRRHVVTSLQAFPARAPRRRPTSIGAQVHASIAPQARRRTHAPPQRKKVGAGRRSGFSRHRGRKRGRYRTSFERAAAPSLRAHHHRESNRRGMISRKKVRVGAVPLRRPRQIAATSAG